jgi:hypothetical protein
MTNHGTQLRTSPGAPDAGSSLVEVVVALGILSTVAAGLLSMAALALTQTENQGHLAARTAEYAQDKMEQLLVLAYGDEVTDTRVFPAVALGGTGLAVGGSANPATPIGGYVDYLDARGNLLPMVGDSPPEWFYLRAWQIVEISPTLKEVRVTATVARAIGRTRRPTATLATIKTHPF